MKIEMGESLFYSWLRHVKDCQIVQTNWKVSHSWLFRYEEELLEIKKEVESHFEIFHNYNVFKKNASLSQIIQQGECDALGVSLCGSSTMIYAVDVAFHEAGLNYGSKEETIMKVIAKLTRTAMCLYSYFDTRSAEIIFASPKIHPAILTELKGCIEELSNIFSDNYFFYNFRLIANEDFNSLVLQPVLAASKDIADTSELFVRSCQMVMMFTKEKSGSKQTNVTLGTVAEEKKEPNFWESIVENLDSTVVSRDSYKEYKIGKLVQLVLKPLIIRKATEEEIQLMQEAGYSKNVFGIQYPLLLKTSASKVEKHYYSEIFQIRGESYRLCSEWYETAGNNDRPFVEAWIVSHE